ncbi:MAG TPA: ABC transporter permease subunit [Thermoanaerobaculia bacterium]|nr:ABC transporter permease subunit [Thermoanaerobaculia bacterium]
MLPDRAARHASPRRPFAVGRRGMVVLAIVLVACAALIVLNPPFRALIPQRGGAALVGSFFSAMFHPALSYESQVPAGTPPLLLEALAAMRRTLVFAAAAMSLALLSGIVLGFLASSAWWSDDLAGSSSGTRWFRRVVAPAIWATTRVLIVGMRSVHELLWAVIFLAAFGLNTASAVIAIAIPYAGTLAKVFSEMIDEAPRDSAFALRAAGAGTAQVFCFGLLPRALPDMCAYAFYRFECAVRSSAVLGFFGFPTLGYSISAAFENLHYAEVWTYLDALALLVVAIELWSGAVRRRFVA